MRSPADHGAGMFRGAFRPVVKLTTKGIEPAKPANVPGAPMSMDPSMDPAAPLNTLHQYG